VTDCDRLLEVLRDGNPHTHHELYKLGMIVHSRVADLRKRGHDIRSWKAKIGRDSAGRDNYAHFYRLVLPALDAPDALHAKPTAEASQANHLPGSGGLPPRSGASSAGVEIPLLSPASALPQPALFDERKKPPWA
jgi:hypothetical protein